MSSKSGILPSQTIAELFTNGSIISDRKRDNDQIQPASLDLRLAERAWRVRASFLPGLNTRVEDKLNNLQMHEIDLTPGAVLETGCVYIVQLQESLKLDKDIAATTNPKSSTGRLDVFTRVIVDGGITFDSIPKGYSGPLYAEICPKSFPVIVRPGSRLSQIRFRYDNSIIPDSELQEIHKNEQLAFGGGSTIINGGVQLSVNLLGNDENTIISYRAKHLTALIDFERVNEYRVEDYWDIIPHSPSKSLTLDPDEFYILASKESVHIPPEYAAEMVPIDPLIGEFRVHYAGFFDPGFGHYSPGFHGSRAVLEVRSHDVPFVLEDGQTVGRLIYEKMAEVPEVIYGEGIGSNYQGQSLKLSKHFKMK